MPDGGRPRRVLLVQELGIGRWHIEQLGAIAHALESLGVATAFMLPDPAVATSGSPLPHRRVLAAPHHMPAPARRRVGATRSFADILCDVGWDDPALLAGLGASWRFAIDLLRPDLIVADFAPTAIAALSEIVPCVAVGLGFTLPPSRLDFFPPFVAAHLDELLDDEERWLEHARAALGVRAKTLPAVFDTPAHVTALGLLDPYRSFRAAPAFGPVEALAPPATRPALASGGEIFVYLTAEDARTGPLVRALGRLGLPLSGHVRDASPAWLDELARDGVTLSYHPAPMAEALARAALVVHHGGAGVVHQAISAARAQLLVPRYLEQEMNAAVLVQRGVGLAIEDVPDDEGLAHLVAELDGTRVTAAVEALCDEVRVDLRPDAAMELARLICQAA
ncbi:MAG: hypothetical protein IT385_25530 [Deltaproteobacteria bacterium]|nr:hypothetical protein [Deltaproteobacteria bacterium]